MSMFSRSSRGNNYRNGNNGSNHYQQKGFLGNLFNMIGSGSNSNRYNNQYQQQYPQQNPNQPIQNQQPVRQKTSICSKCNSPIPTGSKFCLECGQKVNDALFCLNCGESLPLNAKFCLKCGTKLNG